MNDFKELLKSILDSMREEYGPVIQRNPANYGLNGFMKLVGVCVGQPNEDQKRNRNQEG